MNLFFSSCVRRSILGIAVLTGLQLGVCLSVRAASIDVEKVRSSLLLQKEPAGALTPTAAKAAVVKAPKQLVIAGRIAAAKGMDPFVKGKASFAMLQLPDDHASQPGHNADDCPFCKKRLANAPMVAVQFVGADMKELPVDARDLFGVRNGEEVVIRGVASFNAKLALPIIQLQADGIYIRK
tara:strand:- start:773 stop:1318 length:546 start_codon:yes stop_codon:yes gene_type:complete